MRDLMGTDEIMARIDALTQILVNEIYDNMGERTLDPDGSFIVTKAIGRVRAVFGKLYYDMNPEMLEQMKEMHESELRYLVYGKIGDEQ